MNGAQVISVNPAVKTRGELNGGYECLARISRSLSAPGRRSTSAYKTFFNLLFGINGKVNVQTSSKMLLLRVLCAGLMISSVLVPMSPDDILALQFDIHSLVTCAVGLSLVFGIFTRLVSLAGMGWFGYMLYLSFMALQPGVEAGALFLLMAVFAVMGPGIFSADQLMRLGLLSLRRSVLKRRQAHRQRRRREVTLSYRAFAEADSRAV